MFITGLITGWIVGFLAGVAATSWVCILVRGLTDPRDRHDDVDACWRGGDEF